MQGELVSHHLGLNEVLLKHRCVCVSAENSPLLCLSWGPGHSGHPEWKIIVKSSFLKWLRF